MPVFLPILWLSLVLLSLYCTWTLVSKTGHPGWLTVLFCIPVLNVVLYLYFVFADWPVEIELRRYRRLYGPLPEPGVADDTSQSAPCLNCGATVPAGQADCPACGWTYREPVDTQAVEGEILPPDETEQFYRRQRGF